MTPENIRILLTKVHANKILNIFNSQTQTASTVVLMGYWPAKHTVGRFKSRVSEATNLPLSLYEILINKYTLITSF